MNREYQDKQKKIVDTLNLMIHELIKENPDETADDIIQFIYDDCKAQIPDLTLEFINKNIDTINQELLDKQPIKRKKEKIN